MGIELKEPKGTGSRATTCRSCGTQNGQSRYDCRKCGKPVKEDRARRSGAYPSGPGRWVAKGLLALVCHWQVCSQFGPTEFACGMPEHGDLARLTTIKPLIKEPRFIIHECVGDGEKTPLWIKPSGIYRLEPVK